MELGVLIAQPLGHVDRSEAFSFLEMPGVDAVELGTGGLIAQRVPRAADGLATLQRHFG